MKNKRIGKIGEDVAEKFLSASNYQIIKRNFHTRQGEIDIIGIDKSKNQLVFIEVKTRTTTRFGELNETISTKKRKALIQTALYFLNTSRTFRSRAWRIDLIAVKLTKNMSIRHLIHIKNIFDG